MLFDDFDEHLISEDTASGGGGVLRPHPVTLLDLTSIASKIQQTEGDAPVEMPYPGEFIFEELADLYMCAGKIHARLNEVSKNAVFSNNKNAQKVVQNVTNSLCSVKKLCQVMAKQLDGLQLTKLEIK